MEELVSIIVPIYNVEQYLEKCIDSILSQTYKNIEVILVNDGSKDRSGMIAKNYAEKDPRIKYIEQENQGQGKARNVGIENAKGKYVAFVDSDDTIDKKMIERMIEKLTDENLDIVFCDYIRKDDQGNELERYVHPQDELTVYEPEKQKEVILVDPVPWNKIFKKELFDTIKFPSQVWYEDLRTIPKLIVKAKRIGIIKEPLYYYLQRSGSTMSSKNLSRQEESLHALDDLLDYFKANHLYKTYEKELEFLCIAHVYVFGINRLARIPKSKEMIRKFKNYTNEHFPDFHSNPYFFMFTPKEKKFYEWIDHDQIWKIQIGDKVKKEIKKWKKS